MTERAERALERIADALELRAVLELWQLTEDEHREAYARWRDRIVTNMASRYLTEEATDDHDDESHRT
jgi:hypothetical protein